MRLVEIQQRELLHCFDNSWRLMMDLIKDKPPKVQDKYTLVHAMVTNAEGKTFAHGWLELEGNVIDSSRSKEDPLVMNAVKYRDLMNAENVVEYSVIEAMIKAAREGNYGPWDEGSINESARLLRRVYYEWDLETIDEYGDVVDHNHSDKFPGLPTDPSIQLVLVRDQGVGYSDDPDHFEQDDRSWAYVKDGILPDEFDGGDRVPKRFHAEMRAHKRPRFNETFKRKDYVRCLNGKRHDWVWDGGSVVELKTNRNIEDYRCANCRLTKTVFSDTKQRVNR